MKSQEKLQKIDEKPVKSEEDGNLKAKKGKRRKPSTESDEEPAPDVKRPKDDVDDQIEVPETSKKVYENDYTVLGDQVFEDLSAVDMILPYWLAYPEILSKDLSQKRSEVAKVDYINETIKRNLQTLKIKNFFPVQDKLIPFILNARQKPVPFRPQDLCVSSPTGTGKTLAYAVPIVEHLLASKVDCKVRALIMLPVTELAKQVYQVFKTLCNNVKVKCILLSKSNKSLEFEQNLLMEFDEYNNR